MDTNYSSNCLVGTLPIYAVDGRFMAILRNSPIGGLPLEDLQNVLSSYRLASACCCSACNAFLGYHDTYGSLIDEFVQASDSLSLVANQHPLQVWEHVYRWLRIRAYPVAINDEARLRQNVRGLSSHWQDVPWSFRVSGK